MPRFLSLCRGMCSAVLLAALPVISAQADDGVRLRSVTAKGNTFFFSTDALQGTVDLKLEDSMLPGRQGAITAVSDAALLNGKCDTPITLTYTMGGRSLTLTTQGGTGRRRDTCALRIADGNLEEAKGWGDVLGQYLSGQVAITFPHAPGANLEFDVPLVTMGTPSISQSLKRRRAYFGFTSTAYNLSFGGARSTDFTKPFGYLQDRTIMAAFSEHCAKDLVVDVLVDGKRLPLRQEWDGSNPRYALCNFYLGEYPSTIQDLNQQFVDAKTIKLDVRVPGKEMLNYTLFVKEELDVSEIDQVATSMAATLASKAERDASAIDKTAQDLRAQCERGLTSKFFKCSCFEKSYRDAPGRYNADTYLSPDADAKLATARAAAQAQYKALRAAKAVADAGNTTFADTLKTAQTGYDTALANLAEVKAIMDDDNAALSLSVTASNLFMTMDQAGMCRRADGLIEETMERCTAQSGMYPLPNGWDSREDYCSCVSNTQAKAWLDHDGGLSLKASKSFQLAGLVSCRTPN
ncbi:MAG: hypothetical protein AAF337_06190 [Pseudomonadota bacterium]